MSKHHFITLPRSLCLVLLIALGAATAKAQTTQFTYQGKLSDAGSPANGTYDFRFGLFDTATVGTGTQFGTTQTLTNITVTNGLFTVPLDFGACPVCFNGAARFLEIAVKPTSSGTFTTLGPRQPITSTPYAIKTQYLTANGAFNDGTTVFTASNTFTGDGAGLNTTPNPLLTSYSGKYNSFYGAGAGQANTTGDANAFFGTGAGYKNTTGYGNAFFGEGAGYNSSAVENAFFGYQAGFTNTTGIDNAFFGTGAGFTNTTGPLNAFFGTQAGFTNSSGSANAFFGTGAGFTNSTGHNNAFFGYQAGFTNTTGHNNAFIGRGAGYTNTSGIYNTFIRNNADFNTANPTGDYNTLLGVYALVNSGVSNGTAIGHRAQVTQSNSLVLGSINGVNGAIASVNVGIGTTAPSFRFHVRVAGQDGIKIQHNGTSDYPQIRWTDASDAFKASISVGPVGSEGMRFFVNGADRLIIENTGTLWLSNLGAAGSTQLCLNASNQIATCSSSLRYKTDVRPFSGGLEIIHRLRPIAFTWKQGGLRDLGLAAEEVERVEPLLVTHNDKGEVEGIKYDRLNVLLINAVKQQQEQISRQQAQIKQQEAAINQQQQQLKQQQSQIDTLKKLVCLDHPNADLCR